MKKAKVFIICGEASGDLHAANLIHEWLKINPDVDFVGWGGERLLKERFNLLKHVKTLSFMGFWEVLMNIRSIAKNFRTCKQQILEHNPDVLLLIDFPGFNLRMAKWASTRGFKVVYYISPQVWAWKKGRIKAIKSYVNALYCVLPFEKAYFKQNNLIVYYFGHPLLDEIHRFTLSEKETLIFEKPVLALLPGSRIQEIKRKLPVMLEAAKNFRDFEIVVACSPYVPLEAYERITNGMARLRVNQTYELLRIAHAAFVTSGTATLETALFKVPQVVCYKSSPLSYAIAKRIIKVRYISLVNLILNRKVVDELIQDDCNPKALAKSMTALLYNNAAREEMLKAYESLIVQLGEKGPSEKIAFSMNETFLLEQR